MNIVLTGATGFLGRYVIEQLTALGYQVTALVRDKLKASQQQGWEAVVLCEYKEKALHSAFEAADGVIHLAAARPGAALESYLNNVELDEWVLGLAQQHQVPNVVFASTRSVYGFSPNACYESQPLAPLNRYAVAKLQTEILAQWLNEHANMNIKCLRLAQLFGRDEYQGSAVRTFFERVEQGLDIGISVRGLEREYLYVRDAAAALICAIEEPEQKGIFNVGTGSTISLFDLAKTIRDEAGSKSQVKFSAEPACLEQTSVMDSSKFCSNFLWQPSYSLAQAVRRELQDKESRNGKS